MQKVGVEGSQQDGSAFMWAGEAEHIRELQGRGENPRPGHSAVRLQS